MKNVRVGTTAGTLIVMLFLCCCNESSNQKPSEQESKSENIRIVITPLRTKDFGVFYGVEARDETSGTLLARAEQVKMEGQTLVVQETQYSADGGVIYRGKLFFDANDRLEREERIEGKKKWNLFQTWDWNRGY